MGLELNNDIRPKIEETSQLINPRFSAARDNIPCIEPPLHVPKHYTENQILKIQNQEEAIRNVQSALFENDKDIDGIFGKGTGRETADFIRDIQLRNGLPMTGEYADARDTLVKMAETDPKINNFVRGMDALEDMTAPGRKHDSVLDVIYAPDNYPPPEIETCEVDLSFLSQELKLDTAEIITDENIKLAQNDVNTKESNAERIKNDTAALLPMMRKNMQDRRDRQNAAAEKAEENATKETDAEYVPIAFEKGQLSIVGESMQIRDLQQHFVDFSKGFGITDPMQSSPDPATLGFWTEETTTHLSDLIKHMQTAVGEDPTGKYDPAVFHKGIELLKENFETASETKESSPELLEYMAQRIESLENVEIRLEILHANGSLEELYPPQTMNEPALSTENNNTIDYNNAQP